MAELVEFIDGLSTAQRGSFLFLFLFAAILCERLFPFLKAERQNHHVAINFAFLVGVAVVNTLVAVIAFAVLRVDEWQIGLLHWVAVPLWAQLVITILVLDFVAQFGAHWMLHNFKWLWRYHAVHHSDTHVDASTGTRLHPGDFLFREVLVVLTVVVGMPLVGYFLYRIITPFFSYFTHANIRLPLWLDKPLTYLFVTPNMHKVHHHVERPWTDCNYGNILSIWDRMFGTYAYVDPREIVYGLDVLDPKQDRDLGYLLKLPYSNFKTDY